MTRNAITGIVLAGGQGRRMGGSDKGLIDLAGTTLVGRVVERIAPQVTQVIINANRHRERYEAFGHPVTADLFTGSAGPLAGFHAGLRAASTPLVLMVPCDTPALPDTLVDRLYSSLQNDIDIVFARDAQRAHPTVVLMKRHLTDDLERFLNEGGRKINHWYARHSHKACHFDEADAFININTPSDRDAFIS